MKSSSTDLQDALKEMNQPSRREVWLGLIVVWFIFIGLCEAKLWRPQQNFTIIENIQIAEAQAWWQGRLDLPEEKWDSVVVEGKVYSCFPPMFTFVSAVVVPMFAGVPHPLLVIILILPVLTLSYLLFLRQTGSAEWGAVLAIGFVCGSSIFPVIDKTLRGASPYYVNHTVALIGLLIILSEVFGRQRIWLAGAGMMIAALSRQMTIVYAIPLIWLAAQQRNRLKQTKPIVMICGMVVFIFAVNLSLNTLKFGHPLDSGYARIFKQRTDDVLAKSFHKHGLFSPHFVARNLYYANLGFPRVHRIEIAGETQIHLRPNNMGTGIWWTTPLLLWLFLDLKKIIRDREKAVVLVAACVVFAGLMFYHSTGYAQRGFNRYSLDYLPVLYTLVAPACIVGRRKWISVGMIVWSIVYFRFLI